MLKLSIDAKTEHQTFQRFGVSSAWWSQIIGGWTEPDAPSNMPKYKRIAQLLFDPEEGLGVRTYRYNLGAGSDSGRGYFPNLSRRAECFLTKDGYDFSRDSNAVKMMNEAVALGVDEVIFFVNSPPESMTKNGKSHLDVKGKTNLSRKNYLKFTNYCLDCCEHFINQGIPLKYISPVNEPVWIWIGGQEGCHYRPYQVRTLLRVFAKELERRNLPISLSCAENGDIRWFNKTYTRMVLADKIIKKYVDAVDIHSYCVTPDIPIIKHLIKDRVPYMKRYRKFMDRHFPNSDIKISEWTHMQGGRDYGMDSALEQTKIMIEDLTILNAVSWQLWIAVSDSDYCDGLIYENDDDRTFELTKRYYTFGNFTKFIELGDVRIDCTAGEGIKCVAFKNDKQFKVILSNPENQKRKIEIPFENVTAYVTDDDKNLQKFNVSSEFTLSPRSVTTLVIDR